MKNLHGQLLEMFFLLGKEIQKQLVNISLGKKLNKPIFKTKLEKFVTTAAEC